MPDDEDRPSNAVVPLNGETVPKNTQAESQRRIVKRSRYLTHEEKVGRRLDLEFEELDDEKQDVMEVEEIKKKWGSVMKSYLSVQD